MQTSHSHLPRGDNSALCTRALLLEQGSFLEHSRAAAVARAYDWIAAARAQRYRVPFSRLLLDTFGLATAEGGALMRLAEALLRTPDDATAWELICENVSEPSWRTPPEATPKARMTAGLVRIGAHLIRTRKPLLDRVAAPISRAVRAAVRSTADQFVVAPDMRTALERMSSNPLLRLCSIDCLGESARTADQANAYFNAYEHAILELAALPGTSVHERHGISVKLSALEPHFGPRYREPNRSRLIPRVVSLARQASLAGIGFTIDAEEQDRLESTLDVVEALIADPRTQEWEGLGIVTQAYGLRSLQVIDWLAAQARACRRRITMRLVKGAYWDTEIKRAQQQGLPDFPVFIDKAATDVNYLIAARRLFDHSDVIFPQFATHNALSIATILTLAPRGARYEFQRLHGMGEELYTIATKDPSFPPVRAYAPIGSHEDLLAYLIRRMLENGANTSFVRRLMDPATPIEELLEDPFDRLRQIPHRSDQIPGQSR